MLLLLGFVTQVRKHIVVFFITFICYVMQVISTICEHFLLIFFILVRKCDNFPVF